MTAVTTPNVHPESAADTDGQSINLYRLGMLFVVRCRYWTCRAGNDADDLELSADRIDAKAIASFGSKDLLDPERTRKRFAYFEKKARHVLEKHSRPFAAANAHFVPWACITTVIEQLEVCKAEFDEAVHQFIADYPLLRAEWQSKHTAVPDGCYPRVFELPDRFGLGWTAFKVTGAPELTPVEDIQMELEQRRVRDEQVKLMEENLRLECEQFVTGYVMSFRHEVASFCDQVIEQKGQVHGKTLSAIRRKIDHFHAMNVFGDGDAASKLTQLKQQIAGLTGEDLAQQPDVAASLSRACAALKDNILNPDNVSRLTGRLKRRVVLD